jgi:hypothetical protein
MDIFSGKACFKKTGFFNKTWGFQALVITAGNAWGRAEIAFGFRFV